MMVAEAMKTSAIKRRACLPKARYTSEFGIAAEAIVNNAYSFNHIHTPNHTSHIHEMVQMNKRRGGDYRLAWGGMA